MDAMPVNLRSFAAYAREPGEDVVTSWAMAEVIDSAAAEIERLRQQLDDARHDMCERHEAEIERLQAALRELLVSCYEDDPNALKVAGAKAWEALGVEQIGEDR